MVEFDRVLTNVHVVSISKLPKCITIQKHHNLANIIPIITYAMVAGGVTMQYDQKIVRLMRRSNASPDAACVICIYG